MQFYEPFLIWRALKKYDKEEYRNISWNQFYAKHIARAISDGASTALRTEAQNLTSEHWWLRAGCPYYKIWPGVFDQFASTRMDIDTKFLKPPHKTFGICFPKLDEPLLSFKIYGDTFRVTAILVEHFTSDDLNKNREKWFYKKTIKDVFSKEIKSGIDIDEYNTGMLNIRMEFQTKELSDRYLTGVEMPDELKNGFKGINPPSNFFSTIPIVPNRTIEEVIGEIISVRASDNSDPEECVPASIIEACYRIIIGIYFVSTGSQKVLEYDVISKHLDAYRRMREEGNKEKCKEYEAKAKKRGKYGWNVGPERKDRHLVLPKGMTYDEALREAGSRELLYQHTRGGHWHIYWVGSKKSQKQIVKWVEETTVRKDLPIRQIKR